MRQDANARPPRQSPFVINLCSAMTPIPPSKAPDLSDLGNYRVYQSHRREDGRERHRLHLGPFASNADAMRVVSLVRGEFPAALVVRATDDDLRHFDYIPPMPPLDEDAASAGEPPEIMLELTGEDAEEIVLATDPAPEHNPTPDFDTVKTPPSKQVEEVNWDMAGLRNGEPAEEEEPVIESLSLKERFGLEDTDRVRHLSVELKPPSLTTRLFNRLKRKKSRKKR